MRAAKVQTSLRIRAVSPEPTLLAHTSSESKGTFRQKTRSLAPLNGWTCAVKICHDGMLEDTNSLAGAQIIIKLMFISKRKYGFKNSSESIKLVFCQQVIFYTVWKLRQCDIFIIVSNSGNQNVSSLHNLLFVKEADFLLYMTSSFPLLISENCY